MTDYVHLHAHSTYSILDAWGRPEAIAERVAEAGLSTHTLTDHDSTSGHWKFSKEMKALDLKPQFGVEVRVMDDLSQREWKSEEGRRFYPYHLGLIARTQEGYKNLMNLMTLAWQQGIGGRGKYMPAVTWEDIEAHKVGLIGTSGCLSGKISRAVLGQIDLDWRQVLDDMEQIFEPGSFFVEWQNIGLDACAIVARKLAKHPNAVMTHDVHFPTMEQREAQNIMAAIMRWKKVVGPDGQGPMHEDCYLTSADDTWKLAKDRRWVDLKHIKRAMANTVRASEMIEVELPKISMVRYPMEGGDPVEHFKDLIRLGWRKRGLHKLPPTERKVYRDRVRYEFDIIVQKDFTDYFLIISDITRWCVEQDILKGPARGSSAGSLIAWCLEITEVNPLKHGLIFERFIGLNRKDLPDIDMDFPDDRREEIHEYLEAKYGTDYIGYIGTFTTFKAKNALDDVARVFELPHWVPTKIKPYIPERAHGDVRGHMTLTDSMDDFEEVKKIVDQFPDIRKAILLEGQFRGMGVHPAGFIVSSKPLKDFVPIYQISDKGSVVGLDMYDAADAGLLKIDLLGLSTMTSIANARRLIEERHGVKVDYYNLPLDDEVTLDGFRDVDVLGIFQFGGKATKNTLRQIKPTEFTHLVDTNTLSRPGSMLAGTTDKYVAVHQGRAVAESIHPIVDEITSETHNLVIYQEQVLRIMRDFGGLTWAQAGEVRKDISKRVGMERLQRFRGVFIEGAAKKGVSEEIALDVWMKTSTFGAYGFNKSHSVSYALIAYWQMWTKQHFPTEFYYGVLSTEGDNDRRNLFIEEAKRKGVTFLPVDVNRSAKTFSLEPEGIRYGLTQVKGIGDKSAELILEARPFKSADDIIEVRGVGQKTVELFNLATGYGDDLFQLEPVAARLKRIRDAAQATSITDLLKIADPEAADRIDTRKEWVVAGNVISRNYRQEEKLSVQAKSSDRVGAKSDTVIVYIRDESGESFPVVVPGWLANRKVREIWEAEPKDVYLIRGRLPDHGKFYLANGLANTDMQDRANGGSDEAATEQLQLSIR